MQEQLSGVSAVYDNAAMFRWPLVGNGNREDYWIVPVTRVAGMCFAVDHKGEVDAALLPGRIMCSPSRTPGQGGSLARAIKPSHTMGC